MSLLGEYQKSWVSMMLISGLIGLLAACQAAVSEIGPTITTDELISKFGASRDDLRNLYDGREISVSGKVVSDAVMPGTTEYEGVVRLAGEGRIEGDAQLLCWFGQTEASKFAGVSAGTQITVRGVFSGERGVELRFCKLIDPD